MKKNLRQVFTLTVVVLFLQYTAFSQKIGIFDSHGDIGADVKPGSATFIPQTGQYIISGAGNIWLKEDEFHFVGKKMKGDFILYTRVELLGSWDPVPKKVGWTVRKTLNGTSPQITAATRGDGLTSLEYRSTVGSKIEEIKSKITKADIIQLERKGKTYTMRVARYGEPFVTEQVNNLDLGDDVYVGLFVGSPDSDIVETGVFRDVSITIPFGPGEADHTTPMNLGSKLELLDVASGNREVVYQVPYSIQAPNWTMDGKSLIFNSKGLIYNFDLATRKPQVVNTGNVKNNNNDHAISFDGKMLGLSSSVKELGGSIIYTVPITGGNPKQITPKGPSYLHGWSPDGKDLVFCGSRNGEFDVYKIPVDGGPETRLTDANGLDDGPEYTPDGKYIYFNSVRSGLMQIWKMNADGGNQQQVTADDYNNWFPHISPDGKSMVFLSFLKEEVEPGRHPPYKHVYIRHVPLSGGTPKVLAYFYGGQGSINTPSWSPDSKRIAFVSNSDMTHYEGTDNK